MKVGEPKFAELVMEKIIPKCGVRGCILVSLKSHLRANQPNPNNIGLDGSCIRWMKTKDFIQAAAVPSSR